MKVKKSLKIRPHHLLCIQAFKGLGYNDNFIKRMKEVKSLFKDESQKIKIQIDSDYICETCPNLQHRKCINNGRDAYLRMKKRDLRVRSALCLDLRRNFTVKEILGILRNSLNENKIKFLCSDCEWQKKAGCAESLKSILEYKG